MSSNARAARRRAQRAGRRPLRAANPTVHMDQYRATLTEAEASGCHPDFCSWHFRCAGCGQLVHTGGFEREGLPSHPIPAVHAEDCAAFLIYGDPPRCAQCRMAL